MNKLYNLVRQEVMTGIMHIEEAGIDYKQALLQWKKHNWNSGDKGNIIYRIDLVKDGNNENRKDIKNKSDGEGFTAAQV